jgi:hypothetical protein
MQQIILQPVMNHLAVPSERPEMRAAVGLHRTDDACDRQLWK